MQQRSAAGGQPSPYGFAGEEQDPSGLLYLRARTYNPATGRFLQTDPVLGTPNQPRTLHNYAYAFNNPVNYVDPSGQKPPGLGTSTYKRVDARQYRPQFEQARSYANEMAALDRDNAAARSRMYRNAGQIMPVGQSNSWARTRGIRPEQGFNSARSANTVTSMTRGSLDRYYASELSEGHRPKGCGPAKPNHKPSSLDYAFYIRNQARSTGKNIVENVQEFAEDPQGTLEDWGKDIKQRFKAQRAKMYDDFSSGRVFSAKHWKKELAPVALAASIGIGMLPIVGSLYDAYSVWLERDPLTGAPLSKAEKGLIVAGIVGGFVGLGFIDEAGDFGKGIIKGVSSVDEIADAAKSARYADDVADAAKGLGRADEVIDVAKNLDNLDEAIDVAKNLDNIDEAIDVTKNLDNVDEALAVTKNLDEVEDANLISRLDEATAPSAGKGTMKQGDELRESLTRNNKQGALSKRLEKQRVNQRLEAVAANNTKPVKQGDQLRETFRAKPKRPGLNRESGNLSQRIKAAAAHRANGADLNNPAVRNMINRGFGPIQGGSGALDEITDWRQNARRAFEGFNLRTSQRDLDKIPGSKLTPEVENFVTPGKHGDFNRLPSGTLGDEESKLLWTIDDEGAHFVPEEMMWDSSRLKPSHTNISDEAYFGGEAWRTGPNEITINAGSGAFGYNWRVAQKLTGEDLADYVAKTQARYDRAIEYFRELGFEVEVIPVTKRGYGGL